jgi:uncharacterized protein (TIGR00251 family)
VQAVAGGVRVALRVTPKAAQDRIQGLAADASGQVRLKVAVRAVPEDGKANESVVRLLAKAWQVPRSAVALVAGQHDRSKLLQIDGEPQELLARLTGWLQTSFPSEAGNS